MVIISPLAEDKCILYSECRTSHEIRTQLEIILNLNFRRCSRIKLKIDTVGPCCRCLIHDPLPEKRCQSKAAKAKAKAMSQGTVESGRVHCSLRRNYPKSSNNANSGDSKPLYRCLIAASAAKVSAGHTQASSVRTFKAQYRQSQRRLSIVKDGVHVAFVSFHHNRDLNSSIVNVTVVGGRGGYPLGQIARPKDVHSH